MTSSARPPSGGTPRQPWTPDAAPKGVTCPACGLANEAGARTCRNCGLPIASANDPVRGVAPGRVDLPRARRSGVSATVGFVLVVALLLIGGSLAVSGGGGLLSSGGRFFEAEASPTPATADPDTGAVPSPVASAEPDPLEGVVASGTKFDYTCDNAAIKDLSKGRWFLSDVQAGTRIEEDGTPYDQVYWRLSREKKKAAKAVTVTMQWTTPDKAKDKYGITRVQGDRAIVVTFNGAVDAAANQTIDTDQLEDEGIIQIKKIQLFEKNGKVRTVMGVRSDSCARMKAAGWNAKSKAQNMRVTLDLERFDP